MRVKAMLWGSLLLLALSPDYPADGTLFVGLVDHGVYRSVDGGEGCEQ